MERRGRNTFRGSLRLIYFSNSRAPTISIGDIKIQSRQGDSGWEGWTDKLTSSVKSHMCSDPCTKNNRGTREKEFLVWRGASRSEKVKARDMS